MLLSKLLTTTSFYLVQSNQLRGFERKLDIRSELRIKQALSKAADVLYKSWTKSYLDNIDAFGLNTGSKDVMTVRPDIGEGMIYAYCTSIFIVVRIRAQFCKYSTFRT